MERDLFQEAGIEFTPSAGRDLFEEAGITFEPATRNPLAVANDTVIETANAIAGGVGSVANFVSPGNRVSRFIDENIIKPGEQSQSDAVKMAKQQFRTDIAAADGLADEAKIAAKYAASNPLLSAAQAAGSFVLPGGAVKAAGAGAAKVLGAKALEAGGKKAVQRAALGGGAAAGAALSGGDAAGTAYELSKQGGATEEQAVEAARQASVVPAIVGAAGGLVGAERLVAGAKGFTGNVASRAIKTGAVEAAQEGFEEGVTQFEGQRAAVPYNPGLDPMKGVGAAATTGAILGGATGGTMAALTPQNTVSFTPPNSPTAQAGLPEIVVPIVPNKEQTDVSTRDALGPLVAEGGQQVGDQPGPSVGAERSGNDAGRRGLGGGAGGMGGLDEQAAPVRDAASEQAAPVARTQNPLARASDADLLARVTAQVEQAQPEQSQPVTIWTGRAGDGYADVEAAQAGLQTRIKREPELRWEVEQMPSGKYRLAGYEQAQSAITSETGNSEVLRQEQAIPRPVTETPITPEPAAAAEADVSTNPQNLDTSPQPVQIPANFEQVQQDSSSVAPAAPAPKPLDMRLIPMSKRAQYADAITGGGAPPQTPLITDKPDGTLAVTGDPKALKQQLINAGIPSQSIMKSKTGVLIGRSQVAKVREIFAPQNVQSSIDAASAQRDTGGYGPATQAHRDAAATLARAFGGRLQGGPNANLLDAVAPGGGDRGRAANTVSSVARRIFSREVVYVKFKGAPKFNGAVSRALPGHIFINIDSQKPLMAVLGHELLHELGKSQPGIYAELSSRLDTLLKNESAYSAGLIEQYKAQGIFSNGLDTREELEADIVGDNFMDPEFWTALAQEQPSLFRRIADAVIKWLDGIAQKIGVERPFGTDQFLTDIAAAREAVASAMRQFSGAEVGAVTDGATGDDTRLAIAYHGSPHRFDKFTLDKIGTGEGAQAYGYGLYFTDRKEIADHYRKTLSKDAWDKPPRRFFKGEELSPGSPEAHAATLLSRSGMTLKQAREDVSAWIKDADTWSEKRKADTSEMSLLNGWKRTLEVLNEATSKNDFSEKPYQGQLYEVEIPEDTEMLWWDKPLSEQPGGVARAIANIGSDYARAVSEVAQGARPRDVAMKYGMNPMDLRGGDGAGFYQQLSRELGSDRQASAALNKAGIRGIKYLDGSSRGAGDGSYNYVIFDDADVQIEKTFFSIAEDTIEVDGIQRPRTNSKGQQIHPTEDGIRNFWRSVDGLVSISGVWNNRAQTFIPKVRIDGLEGNANSLADLAVREPFASQGYGGLDIPGRAMMLNKVFGVISGDRKIAEAIVRSIPVDVMNSLFGKKFSPKVGLHDVPMLKDVLSADAKPSVSLGIDVSRGIDALVRVVAFFGAVRASTMRGRPNKSLSAKIARIFDFKIPARPGAEKVFGSDNPVVVNGESNLAGGAADSFHDFIETFDDGVNDTNFVEVWKAATGNQGTFDPNNADIRFSTQAPQGQRFTLPEDGATAITRIKLQDDALRMKRVIDAVKEQGGTVGEEQNFYDANTLMPGRVQSMMDDFRNDAVLPMLKKAAAADISMDELSLYAYARHAEERNAYIASINPKMPDGGSGMTNADARAILAEFEKSGKAAEYEDLHSDLMGIAATTRRTMLDEGLVTQEQYDAMESQYENYIPLRGFENVDAETGAIRPGTGRGINVRGKETIRALGRRSRAGDLIENVIRDYQRAVVKAEKNNVAKVLLDFVLSNPDPDLWGVDVEKGKATLNKATGQVEYATTIDKGEDTIGVKVGGEQVYIKIEDKALARALRHAWKDETGDLERAAVAVSGWYNTLLRNVLTRYNPPFALVNTIRDAQSGAVAALDELGAKGAKRFAFYYPKAVAASYRGERGWGRSLFQNPVMDKYFEEFKNSGAITGGFFMKDLGDIASDMRTDMLQYGAAPKNLSERARASIPWFVGSKVLRALEFMGSVSENTTRFALYMAARDSGRTPSEAALLAKNGTTNFNRKGEWGGTLNALYLFFNAAVQGNAQLFKTLKNPKVRAAMATVAGVGVAAAIFGAAGGGEDDDGQAYWDKIPDYEKERNLIIMLPPGDSLGKGVERVGQYGRYIKIPVQYGLNFFPNIGYMVADVYRNQQDPASGKTIGQATKHLMSVTFGSVNPFGGSVDVTDSVSLAMAMAPTLLDLPIMLGTERNSFGSLVAPSKFPGDTKPDSERMFASDIDTVPANIAKALNDWGGGNEAKPGKILGVETSITPGTIENLIRASTGGLGIFGVQLWDVGAQLASDGGLRGKGAESSNWPVLNKVYGEVGPSQNIRLAGERMREVRAVSKVIKDQIKMGIEPEVSEADDRLQELAKAQEQYDDQMRKLRKEEISILKDKELTNEKKRLELDNIRALQDELSSVINRVYLEQLGPVKKGELEVSVTP